MSRQIGRFPQTASSRCRQRGVITTFTGVLILVLLTLMMFFAMRVGVFEQRVSANESRQKLAFHAAESGIEHAKEFFLGNTILIASDAPDLLPNGTDGWLAETNEKRWQQCSEAGLDLLNGSGSHPCFGEAIPQERANVYYYVAPETIEPGVAVADRSRDVPVGTTGILPGTTEKVTVEALLCVLELDPDEDIPVQGCSTDRDIADGSYYMITLLARGEADCQGEADADPCFAEALVSEQVSNFGATAGGNSPDVPLTTKSSFPPSGTAEVVPNPNAGGVGVPISVWMNKNSSCGGSEINPSSGSWSTCEMHEWYGIDIKPDDMACPDSNCSCLEDESISYTHAGFDRLGIDLVEDTNFPCDLFEFYFGVPRANYEVVKSYAKLIADCDSLDENSFGIYWVTGSSCFINSGATIGSKDNPVLLVSAASLTRLNGGAKFYGVIFVTDVEKPEAELQSLGTNTVYGSVINDGLLGAYQGTFQVVWADDVSEKAANSDGLGSVPGGWSDFHQDWE